MLLITGASGSAGGAVLAEVRKAGVPYKAMYRSKEDAAKASKDTPVVVADFADKDSLREALRGLDGVFLVCSPIPDLVKLETNVIDVAAESGVKHVVLNSALGAEDYAKSFPKWHRQVEEHLKASGIRYTILRPNGFMQNILAYVAPSVRQQGAFYAAMNDAKTSFIDLVDIAIIATKALLAPAEHAGKTYELNGPEAVTNAELAARISKVAGREVKFVNIPEEAQREAMSKMGMPAWQVDALLDLQRYYTGGQGGEVTPVLEQLLGHAPTHLNSFLQAHKESFHPDKA